MTLRTSKIQLWQNASGVNVNHALYIDENQKERNYVIYTTTWKISAI